MQFVDGDRAEAWAMRDDVATLVDAAARAVDIAHA